MSLAVLLDPVKDTVHLRLDIVASQDRRRVGGHREYHHMVRSQDCSIAEAADDMLVEIFAIREGPDVNPKLAVRTGHGDIIVVAHVFLGYAIGILGHPLHVVWVHLAIWIQEV